jgi:hypothetical protein
MMGFDFAEEFHKPILFIYYFIYLFSIDYLLTLCYMDSARKDHNKHMRPLGVIIRYFGPWDHSLAGDPWLATFCIHSPRW